MARRLAKFIEIETTDGKRHMVNVALVSFRAMDDGTLIVKEPDGNTLMAKRPKYNHVVAILKTGNRHVWTLAAYEKNFRTGNV